MNFFTLYLIIGTVLMLIGFKKVLEAADNAGVTATWRIVCANMINMLLWPVNLLIAGYALYTLRKGGKK